MDNQFPPFTADGLLPPGDYEVTIAELRASMLVLGPGDPEAHPNWDAAWREKLVDNLSILADQLFVVGINEIFADGSFVEDKDHPNDIDGYFVCSLNDLASGKLQRELNLLDKFENMDVGSLEPQALQGLSQKATAHVASISCRTLPACRAAYRNQR